MRVRRAQARLCGRDARAPKASYQNQDLRDYRIFRILPARVFDWQALIRIRLGEISGYGENASRAKEIPPILKILILTKTRGRPPRFPIKAKTAS